MVLAAGGLARPAAAQDSTSTKRGDWLIGVSVGVPGYDGQPLPELFTLGVQFTQLRPGQLGADFSLGTMPRTITSGYVALGGRAGLAFPLALSRDVMFVPSAGLSFIGVGGPGGAEGTGGFNAGAGVVILGGGPVALRMGLTAHQFSMAEGGLVWLAEIGVGGVR